jgi:hypothetical protein
LAVDDERESTPQVRILEHRPIEIEAVVIDAELRRDVELRGEIFLDVVELPARDDGRAMQLAGAVGAQLRVLVRDLRVLHRVEFHRGGVPVVRISLRADVAALRPFREHERAVRDLVARAGEALAEFLERRPMQRRGRWMRHQAR